MPKISIITINRNDAVGLAKTISSVASQSFTDFEYIVIDGNSTDNSIDIIKQNGAVIDVWKSEADSGIYNAMNKGISLSKGEYCLFLNAGDYLFSASILQEVFKDERTEDILYGDQHRIGPGGPYKRVFPDKLSFMHFYAEYLGHNSTFIKTELFNTLGNYNENRRIVADWEFLMLAICKYNCSTKHLPFCISTQVDGGISNHPSHTPEVRAERNACLKEHFPLFVDDYEKLYELNYNKIGKRMTIRKFKTRLKNTPLLGKLVVHVYNRFFIKPYDAPQIWLNKLLKADDAQIVQIGSNDGITGDPIYDLVKNNIKWKALFVEPIPYLFKRLKRNYGSDSRFTFENVAINDGTDQIFYCVREDAKSDLPDLPIWYDQLGSFYKENILNHCNGILEPYIEEVLLSGITLEKLLKRNNIKNITLLHIDTEGYDWKILSQLELDYLKPKIILIEHKHLDEVEKKSLITFLKSDYSVFRLGGDLLAILNDYANDSDLKGLKGINIE